MLPIWKIALLVFAGVSGLVFAAPPAPPSGALKDCFAKVTCWGNYAYNLQAINKRMLGISFYFPVGRGKPFPNLVELVSREKSRFTEFESRCNRERYRTMPLSPDPAIAWEQDSKLLGATYALACKDSGSCSEAGGPCRMNSECCGSGAYVCEQKSGSCVPSVVTSE